MRVYVEGCETEFFGSDGELWTYYILRDPMAKRMRIKVAHARTGYETEIAVDDIAVENAKNRMSFISGLLYAATARVREVVNVRDRLAGDSSAGTIDASQIATNKIHVRVTNAGEIVDYATGGKP